MSRDIKLKVSFGDNELFLSLARAKHNIRIAKCEILNVVRPALKKLRSQTPEIIIEDGEETIYFLGSVDFDKEEAISKEICQLCDALYKKIEEYDILMNFEISKVSRELDTKE